MIRLFIDPGSKSMGWAIFEGKELVQSGTVKCKGSDSIDKRLYAMAKSLKKSLEDWDKFDEINVERLNSRTHHFALWSVGMIASVVGNKTEKFREHPSPAQWKKPIGLKFNDKGEAVRLVFEKLYPGIVTESDDEMEAILMGHMESNFGG